ncbi:hypothetical protein EJ05DRAFT_41289 [Pseudovirgaria hyperparasitica]|uniref:Small secreted protein n=1 Tax=Pseudovirgaria hyperparasitica TaxID=470096 RepID=A0A6A6WN80_9PEZI|nr:uncharacterized protein EJ05DRAFT_41289 [Pseudovirgaria hyperparasitica]KAF2763499.1 hypothetical protein EJ05DRAFT_41289 [Pseudovirgaria hyperparasitica]
MQLNSITLLVTLLATSAVAFPTYNKRATARSFAELSISDGTAGSAKADALAKLPIDMSDLAAVSADDLDTLKTERETAEAAETDAFNPAIEAASGDEATALQNGKIANKVLKLTFEVTALQVQQAQGDDVADKIAVEQKKLDTNIALDEKAAGEAMVSVDFSG